MLLYKIYKFSREICYKKHLWLKRKRTQVGRVLYIIYCSIGTYWLYAFLLPDLKNYGMLSDHIVGIIMAITILLGIIGFIYKKVIIYETLENFSIYIHCFITIGLLGICGRSIKKLWKTDQ